MISLNEAADRLGIALADESGVDPDLWIEAVRRKCARPTIRFAHRLVELGFGRSGGWELTSDALLRLESAAKIPAGWGAGSLGNLINKGLLVRHGWASTDSYRPVLATGQSSARIYHARYDCDTGTWTTAFHPVEDVVAAEQMPRLDA